MMKADTLLKIETALQASRRENPEPRLLLFALVAECGGLADALGQGKPRASTAAALRIAALAIRLAEEGDAAFPMKVTIQEPA
jgi:hypothetical protein